jgi:hypothetical protein
MALSESRGEALLGELLKERQIPGKIAGRAATGKATLRVCCLVREPFGMSSGKSLGEVLPISYCFMAKIWESCAAERVTAT